MSVTKTGKYTCSSKFLIVPLSTEILTSIIFRTSTHFRLLKPKQQVFVGLDCTSCPGSEYPWEVSFITNDSPKFQLEKSPDSGTITLVVFIIVAPFVICGTAYYLYKKHKKNGKDQYPSSGSSAPQAVSIGPLNATNEELGAQVL